MKEKPTTSEITFLGKMYGQDVWGNEGALKKIEWLQARLKEEMEKNLRLEQVNFVLSARPRKKFLGLFPL